MSEKTARAERIKVAMSGRPIAWLATQLGVALSTAHSYMKGTVPPADVAIKISNILDVDLKWYVNGSDVVSDNVVDSVSYTAELLTALTENPNDVRCMLQKGTAMRPTIPQNAETLFIPMTTDPEDGRVYVLFYGKGAIVRRVMQTTDGNWKAVCDNPAFRGEEKDTIDPKSFVGEVIWTSFKP
jgi:phage repressor protein C with HTH and peptisase S24 domain